MRAGGTERFNEWAGAGDLDALVRYLMSGVHHGRPGRPTDVKRQAVRALEEAGDPARRFAIAKALAVRDEYVARELACALLDEAWPEHRNAVTALMQRLADDADWEVRETAAGLLARVMERDFDGALRLYTTWTGHPSPNVRRAVVLAAKYVGGARRPEQARPLLSLVERLLPDKELYVRTNLGPFAIGDGLLRSFPDETLAKLKRWAARRDEGTRWNVAMAFSSAEGAKHPDAAFEVLEFLAADDRRYVWRAAASAMRSLAKRHPQRVREALAAWRKDPRRAPAAAAAEAIAPPRPRGRSPSRP